MKRIILVDDEQDILDGLKRMLRSRRHVWDMVFALSGEEALVLMEADPFDVIVTDMKMPGMSGAELLAQVQVRYPKTVRIVLSGYADVEASMRSVAVSHQFLAKPCDADALKRVVDRACDLGMLLESPSLLSALGSLAELPVLPRVYKALTAVLDNDEVNLKEIGAIIEQDVGIAAKVLKVVNSSYFGLRVEITDLGQAASYLGVSTLRDLVLTFEMFQECEGGTKFSRFSMEREQSHSLLTARIARNLLDEKEAKDQAFLAGMLHDVGKLVLATRVTEQFELILNSGAGVERPFHTVEEEILKVSHAEIGAYLLGLWGMSYPVVEAVAHHHHPSRVPEQSSFGVLGATHVADCLALEQTGAESNTIELDEPYLEKLGVAEKLDEWRDMAAEVAGILVVESN